ncbi:MAG: cell division protein FtsX [Bacteroidota bacterium]
MKPKESNISKGRLRSSYLTSLISISLVLFLLGLVGLLLLNTKHLSDYVRENIGLSVILKDNVREVDVIRLQKILDAKPYVKSTEYVTKEQAAKELQEELGEDFVDFLGYNPLLASIDVRLVAPYANNDSIQAIEEDFNNSPIIKEVFYRKSLVQAVNDNVHKISVIILAFSGLLFLVAIALINNTIRLSIYSKRFIINTMQLVGATQPFIRRPFVFKSMLHGIYGALIALVLISGLLYASQKEINEFISFHDMDILAILFIIILMIGALLSTISTFFAVNKYLNIKSDNLYY